MSQKLEVLRTRLRGTGVDYSYRYVAIHRLRGPRGSILVVARDSLSIVLISYETTHLTSVGYAIAFEKASSDTKAQVPIGTDIVANDWIVHLIARNRTSVRALG
jgi:hypothetical protein